MLLKSNTVNPNLPNYLHKYIEKYIKPKLYIITYLKYLQKIQSARVKQKFLQKILVKSSSQLELHNDIYNKKRTLLKTTTKKTLE
jgi:hypothetical protein